MSYLFVGAGQAGSAIVDEVFQHQDMDIIATPMVINSTIRDLENLSNVGTEAWYGIAPNRGLIAGDTEGFEEHVTGGFGRDPFEANEVVQEIASDNSIEEAIATRLENQNTENEELEGDVRYAFLLFGLGGGTGCGSAKHIARAIRSYADGPIKIIALCILPNTEGPVSDNKQDDREAMPSRQARNARYGLNQIEDEVDGIILVDNQRLSYHVAAEGKFTEYNEYIASALVDMVSGPVLEGIDPGNYEDVDPPIIDLRDVVTALSFDVRGENAEPGYAALGRAVTMTKSLPGYLLPFVGKKDVDSAAMAELAGAKQTLSDANLGDAAKTIGLVRAPPKYIRDVDKGIKTSIFSRYLQQHSSKETNLGVTLTKRNLASFTALFTFHKEDIKRLKEIEALAEEYEDKSASLQT